MKIAIVTPVFPPYRGGIGTLAELDARQLATLGHEVHVFTPGSNSRQQTKPCGCVGAPYAVHFLRPWLRYGKAALVPQVTGLLRRFDLVLLQHPFFGGTEPLAVARMMGVGSAKMITAYHMDVVGTGLVKAFAAPTRHFLPRILGQADAVTVTSTDYARSGDAADALAERPDLFAEIPPAVDIARFAPAALDSDAAARLAALRARYRIKEGEPVVVLVGGLDKAHYFKGVPFLLEALATRALAKVGGADVRAVIVGDGDLRPGFESRARTLGIAGRVTFAGGVSDAALADHYRLGDVLAFPSVDKSEAFGMVALESMACGVPVVASDLAGVRTLVRDGVTGLRVPPRDAEALAGALASLLANRPRREAMGHAARIIAEREYSVPARLARWKALLARVAPDAAAKK